MDIIMKNKKDLELVTTNPSGCKIWSEKSSTLIDPSPGQI